MKIGIVTYYDVVNYGAVLLAYSMQKYLESLGHNVEFLRYDRKRNTVYKPTLLQKLRSLLPNARKMAKAEAKKRTVFADFRKEYLNVGRKYHDAKDLDVLIIGSDQIFDCKNEFNDYQYGIHAPCEKIIAYAPCFGEVSLSMVGELEHRTELKDALCAFYKLSARDTNTRDIITELTGKTPPLVLDPVLLYGFEEEKKQWSDRLIKEDYVVVYTWSGLTVTDAFTNSVKAFAKKHKLKTVSVGDRRPWCDYDYASATPVEFFEIMMHSSAVITNMFHGTCFSILLERPFFSFVMPHNRNKLFGLLEQFHLESQAYYSAEDIISYSIPAINYSAVNDTIAEYKKQSISYIDRALSSEN